LASVRKFRILLGRIRASERDLVPHCITELASQLKSDMYEITDDSGFMALVDPAAYRSFVDSKWTLNQLFRHFKEEMKYGRLLIWGTGREDVWRVEVRFGRSPETGLREFSTKVRASTGQLLLTNYESLTMAAQFENVLLPENHQRGLIIPVPPGVYHCRVVQRLAPEIDDPVLRDNEADFLVQLTLLKNSDEETEDLSVIPWTEF
jgi:hypothetical protein